MSRVRSRRDEIVHALGLSGTVRYVTRNATTDTYMPFALPPKAAMEVAEGEHRNQSGEQ
jgi:hypothetical protein